MVFVFYDLKAKKVLMEKRISDQVFSGAKVFPGGKVENSDKKNFLKTLVREIQEELGVRPLKFVGFKDPIIGETGYSLWIYLVTKWTGEIPDKISDKGSGLIWVGEDEFESELRSVRKIYEKVKRYIVAQS